MRDARAVLSEAQWSHLNQAAIPRAGWLELGDDAKSIFPQLPWVEVKKLCRECDPPQPPTRARGLGDVIHRVAKFLGFKHCSACEKRRRWLNDKVPFND